MVSRVMTGGVTAVSASTLLPMQSPPMLQETCNIHVHMKPSDALCLLGLHLLGCKDFVYWMFTL